MNIDEQNRIIDFFFTLHVQNLDESESLKKKKKKTLQKHDTSIQKKNNNFCRYFKISE